MRRKINAFTLVELLVVISIIAFLLSVLMPALGKTRDQARRILCASNLKTIGMGEMMYSEASDDWHLPAFYWNESRDPDAEEAMWFQNPLFITLVDLKGRDNEEDTDIFEAEARQGTPQLKDLYCPYDKRTVANGGLHVEAGEIVQGSSYAMNMTSIRPTGGWAPGIVYALKTDQVVKPAEKIFFMDGQWFVVYIGGAEYKRVWDVYGDRMGPWEWDAASYRHDEGANITFYDGHVDYWKKERVYPMLPKRSDSLKAQNAIWMPIPGREFFEPFEP
jgi:prepilin-type processing-associated H-X9-DG protein/prepilin-type N-terminal cleavage/methylation domain-containing protein